MVSKISTSLAKSASERSAGRPCRRPPDRPGPHECRQQPLHCWTDEGSSGESAIDVEVGSAFQPSCRGRWYRRDTRRAEHRVSRTPLETIFGRIAGEMAKRVLVFPRTGGGDGEGVLRGSGQRGGVNKQRAERWATPGPIRDETRSRWQRRLHETAPNQGSMHRVVSQSELARRRGVQLTPL